MSRLFGLFSRELFMPDVFEGKVKIKVYSRLIQEYTKKWSDEMFEELFFTCFSKFFYLF